MDKIVETIYEAAVRPDRWDDVLRSISRLIGADAAYIYSTSGVGTFVSARPVSDYYRRWERGSEFLEAVSWYGYTYPMESFEPLSKYSGHGIKNKRIQELFKRIADQEQQTGFVDDVITILRLPLGEVSIIGFDRVAPSPAFFPEQVDVLNILYPDIARAMLLSDQLKHQRVSHVSEAVGMLGLPCAALTSKGILVAANEPMARSGLLSTSPAKRVELGNQTENRRLLDALAKDEPETIVIGPARSRQAAVLQVVPFYDSQHVPWTPKTRLVLATEFDGQRFAPASPILRAAFGLTDREATLAHSLATGRTVKEAALDMGIAFGTARSYLLQVFLKTETDHQGALISKLLRLPSIFLGT